MGVLNRFRFTISLALSILIHFSLFLSLFLNRAKIEFFSKSSKSDLPLELQVELNKDDEASEKGLSDKEMKFGQDKGKDGMKLSHFDPKVFARKFGVGKQWEELLNSLSQTSNLRENYPEIFDEINYSSGVKDSYKFRKRHYEDLIVKEVFPTIRNVEKPFKQILKEASRDLNHYNRRNDIIQKFRKWTKGEISENRSTVRIYKTGHKKSQSPLDFPKKERDHYFDLTLRQPKETQLYNFINRYFDYDPDKGDLPIAVRELYYKNLQRIAYTFSPDATYMDLDYFEENLNKEDFLKNSLAQAARLKDTKTQTELLFAVLDIYEIQQNAWHNYFYFDSTYNSLSDAKKRGLRVETLRRIRNRYKPVLKKKHLKKYLDIVNVYGKKREEIIDYIIRHSPNRYRVNDALFEKGRLHWDLGTNLNSDQEKQKAINIWEKIKLDPGKGGDSSEGSDWESDFVFRNTVERIQDVIEQYRQSNSAFDMQYKIQNILLRRQSERMHEKSDREEKILWP